MVGAVAVHEDSEGTKLTIKSPYELVYAAYKLFDPLRLLVEFPHTALDPSLKNRELPGAGLIRNVTVKSSGVPEIEYVLLTAALTEDADYEASTEDNQLTFVLKPVGIAATARESAGRPEARADEVAGELPVPETEGPASESSTAEEPTASTPDPYARFSKRILIQPGQGAVETPPAETDQAVPEPEEREERPQVLPTSPMELKRPESPIESGALGDSSSVVASYKAFSDRIEFRIHSKADIQRVHRFELSAPDRLVLDLYGVHPSKALDTLALNRGGLKEVRIGKHEDKTRIVFEFAGAMTPPAEIREEPREVFVVFSSPALDRASTEISLLDSSLAEPDTAFEFGKAPVLPTLAEKVRDEAKESSPKQRFSTAETLHAGPPRELRRESAEPAPTATVARKKETKSVVAAYAAPQRKKSVPSPSTSVRKADRNGAVSFDFHDAEIRSALRMVGSLNGLQLVAAPEVQGRITLKMKVQSLDEALERILDAGNLQQVRCGRFVWIAPAPDARLERIPEPYAVSPRDLRDPFKPFPRTLARLDSKGSFVIPDTGLRSLEAIAFRFVGIMSRGNMVKALVQDPRRNEYVVGLRESLGSAGGKVVKILPDRLIVSEKNGGSKGKREVTIGIGETTSS